MFITSGSCSVMLLWATRRIRCCHGSAARSMGARRAGSVVSFTADTAPGAVSCAGSGERALSVDVRGIAAPVVRPVLRKARRLSICTPMVSLWEKCTCRPRSSTSFTGRLPGCERPRLSPCVWSAARVLDRLELHQLNPCAVWIPQTKLHLPVDTQHLRIAVRGGLPAVRLQFLLKLRDADHPGREMVGGSQLS